MPSDAAKRFIRINYDDQERFPWIIMWGEDHMLRKCRTLDHAKRQAKEIQDICDVFYEWIEKKPPTKELKP